MRLITIGSSAQSNVVLRSQFVSRNHAELILLENGDILLVDKGSSNGTFVNGNRVSPNTEVVVTLKDTVQFADQPLNWSSIPLLPPVSPNVKVLKGIGSHYRNAYRVQGPNVSRFHATVKQMKNDKWYICDHSDNGTTVNGRPLPKDQYMPLKAGDVIMCAGTPVINPAGSGSGASGVIKKVALGLCACLLVALAVWGVSSLVSDNSDKSDTTVFVEMEYYYTIAVDSYHAKGELRIGWNSNKKEYDWLDNKDTKPVKRVATGFFMGDKGLVVTNRHVAQPWVYDDYLAALKKFVKNQLKVANSDIKISGKMVSLTVCPNNRFISATNKIACNPDAVVYSDIKDVDLAIIQTVTEQVPEGSTYVPIKNVRKDEITVGDDVETWGFPGGTDLQVSPSGVEFQMKKTQAICAKGHIKNIEKFAYGHSANVVGGASGSPVFDSHGNVIGVISHTKGAGYNYCIKSKFIHYLLKKMESCPL